MNRPPSNEKRFLVFSIRGEYYNQVRDWIVQADQAVFRHQFERQGSVMVSRWHGKRHFGSVNALPPAGEAEPWYGEVGGAYTYAFRPAENGGCEVTVRNGAHGGSFFPPEPYPPLHLLVPEAPEFVRTGNGLTDPAGGGWFNYDDQAPAQRMFFRLSPQYVAMLAAWSRWGDPLPAYTFFFNPSNVGMAIRGRHITSGDEIDLTKDVDW